MQKIVLTRGMIAGAIMGAFMFGTQPFHEQIGFGSIGMVIGYTSMVLAFLMIHSGMVTYRDTIADGTVSYGQALKVGLLIMLIASAIYVACWEIIYFTISPDFVEKYAEFSLQQARAAGKSPAELAELAAQMQDFATQYKNPLVNIAYTFLEPLPVGLLFSFVSAWLVSRKAGSAPPRPITA
jgi:hypothetical protein